jgi:RES domain-containing protein
VRHVRLGGEFLRVADPGWANPLNPSYAQAAGGRWNPPGSFPVVYLCREVATARANVYRRLAGLPYGPEDLTPRAGPVLVATNVPEAAYVDAISKRGLGSLGLPASYPKGIGWERCQPLGLEAWNAGEPGVAARSAAPNAPADGVELAYFRRRRGLRAGSRRGFDEWFWGE